MASRNSKDLDAISFIGTFCGSKNLAQVGRSK